MTAIIIFLYVLPAILSVIVMIYRIDEIYVYDLIGILLTSLIPMFNIFIGYIGGLVCLTETKKNKQLFKQEIKMKILHISDTHTYHDLLQIPDGIDMVIHSGDCSNPRDPYNNEPEVREFIHWFKGLPIKHKVYVAGNHDTSIEKRLVTKKDFEDYNIHYLENEYIEIDGLKLFGSPHTPQFNNWAFMKDRVKLERFWRQAISKYADIIITHGPPKGALDKSYDRDGNMEMCGDKSLLNRILELNPKLSLFGHIHNCDDIVNAGTLKFSNCETIFSNGSVVTDGKFGKVSSNGNIFEL